MVSGKIDNLFYFNRSVQLQLGTCTGTIEKTGGNFNVVYLEIVIIIKKTKSDTNSKYDINICHPIFEERIVSMELLLFVWELKRGK